MVLEGRWGNGVMAVQNVGCRYARCRVVAVQCMGWVCARYGVMAVRCVGMSRANVQCIERVQVCKVGDDGCARYGVQVCKLWGVGRAMQACSVWGEALEEMG